MELSVYSEIGQLEKVIVHRPGQEVDSMPPFMMKELLFDDIIYGPGARQEHDRFVSVMRRLGVEVVDFQRLLAEALEEAVKVGSEAIPRLLDEIELVEGLDVHVIEELSTLPLAALSRALVEGLPSPPGEAAPDSLFRMPPIPNLLFSRDAQVVIADGVVISGMSRKARRREPLLSRFIFQNHPLLAGASIYADFSYRADHHVRPENMSATLEGGDVLILDERTILVGVSERTTERAADALIERLRSLRLFETLIMVPIPRARSAMHLDTIFTQISAGQCLVYGPMILSGGTETLSVITVDLRSQDDWGARRPSLLDALARAGIDLEPICCGGRGDYIQQAREQWTDGANSFAIRSGVVLLYARNAATAIELDRAGYHVVTVDDMSFSKSGECLYDFTPGKNYAILVAGHELSRARGGPRCMTMPLVREKP